MSAGLQATHGTTNVDNSVITAQDGIVAHGGTGYAPTVHAVNDTIVAAGPAYSRGIVATTHDPGSASSVTAENSVVAGATVSFETSGPGLPALTVRYSDYTAPVHHAAGQLDESEANRHSSPGFVDLAAGDFRVGADSPLLDAGDPTPIGLSNTSDLAGAKRSVGSGPDLGAFEFQPHAPAAAISGPDTAVVGKPVTFTSAGPSDPDPGDALTAHWTIDGAPSDGAEAAHTFQTPGKATVELTVKDIGGGTSTVSRVVDVQPAPVADSAPIVNGFSITKRRVALKAKRPAAFRFKLSENAGVRISFARLGKKGRVAKKTGALVRTAHAGQNRVVFSGRVGRRALKTGRYRATLIATDATGHRSLPRTVKFTVRAR